MVHSNRILSYYQWVHGCHKIYLSQSQLLALGLAQALGLHRAIGVERAVVTSAIVIEIDVRLQTSASGQVLSHLRAASDLLNAVRSTLRIDVDGGDVVTTVGVSGDTRRYFFSTALPRRTNCLGSLDGLSGLRTALAHEVL